MKQLKEEIEKAMNAADRESSKSFTTGDYAQVAVDVTINWMCEFRDWYDKLSPSQKCTVWPPAGSGSGTGLYNMETKDIVDKFLTYKRKYTVPEPIDNQVVSNGISDPGPESNRTEIPHGQK